RSAGQQPGKRRWNREHPDRCAGCEGEAGGVCGIILGVWRYADAAQARRDEAESDLALCSGEAGERVLHGVVLSVLWTGDGVPAVLQYFWPTAGSDVAVLWSAGEVHHADAGWRATHDLRRWQAEP